MPTRDSGLHLDGSWQSAVCGVVLLSVSVCVVVGGQAVKGNRRGKYTSGDLRS